jgi:hypothetical protein
VQLEIRPEPSPEERAAIETALRRLERGEPERGRWWESGLPPEEDEAEET